MFLELLGVAALLFGLFFCAVGVIGVIRLPDSLTRLHASGKVATLGLFGLLLGAALLMPSTSLRLLALGLFVLLTSPVATHAIAASVYRRREIVEALGAVPAPSDSEGLVSVDVTAVLSQSILQDIIDAQEKTQRNHGRGTKPKREQ